MMTYALDQLTGKEDLTAWLSAESSDFVRINQSRVRQAGHVTQSNLSLRLVNSGRHALQGLTLTGDADSDKARISGVITSLREVVAAVAPDPHLLLCESAESVIDIGSNQLPTAAEATQVLLDASQDADLVGIWASGPIHAGFASSWGQRSFHTRHAYHVDFSVHLSGDKAVKAEHAGFEFTPQDLTDKVSAAKIQLTKMRRTPVTVRPGDYRAWLSPAAVGELVGLLAWDGFGAKSQQTRQSPLQRIVDGTASLSPLVSISESPTSGVAPRFGSAGFLRPAEVPLISAGRHAGSLVSPRSAQEYGLNTTGAGESPDSLTMAAGSLADADVLRELGTGIYVGNLWYTNWSDRPAGRLTGMTRFATFWVENGELVAPLSVMRFDDTLERMLGSELIALGNHAPLSLSSDTYEKRSTGSVQLPGALLRQIRFTL